MKYDNYRDEIRTGDLLAFRGGSWKTWYGIKVNLVRMFTRSEYSHVAIAWVVGGRVLMFESVTGGVRIVPLSSDLPVYWIKRPMSMKESTIDFLLSTLKEPYSSWQGILAVTGLLKVGKDRVWQCAELVITAYTKDDEDFSIKAIPTAIVLKASKMWDSPLYYLEA
jgi:uncharacterized protein YycO